MTKKVLLVAAVAATAGCNHTENCVTRISRVYYYRRGESADLTHTVYDTTRTICGPLVISGVAEQLPTRSGGQNNGR